MSTPEHRIEQLETKVKELEAMIDRQNQSLVEICANHIQRLFQEPTLLDTISYRILLAGANAIHFKASQSEERAAELIVIEGYIPGALRASIAEDGSFSIDQQLKGATNQSEGWESAIGLYQEKGILDTFRELVAAYGAEANRFYYITDTVTRQKHLDAAAAKLADAGIVPGGLTGQPAEASVEDEGKGADDLVYRTQVVKHRDPNAEPITVEIPQGIQVVKHLENDQAQTVDISELVAGDVFNTVTNQTALVVKSIVLSPRQLTRPSDPKFTIKTAPLNPVEGDETELTAVFHTEDEVYARRNGEKLVLHPQDVQVGDVIEVSRNHSVILERVIAV